ncbi:hypothetical protein BZY94_06245 [Burkholderia territorii]|nr:hypothetical protein BZY94_06245 [Burkholderia territorii]
MLITESFLASISVMDFVAGDLNCMHRDTAIRILQNPITRRMFVTANRHMVANTEVQGFRRAMHWVIDGVS